MKQYVARAFDSANQGLKDAVEMLDFILFGFRTFKDAQADGGGINWKDFPKVLALVGPADDAFDGAENIWPELKSANEDEIEAILSHLNEGLAVKDQYNRETLQLVENFVVSGYLLGRHIVAGRPEVEDVVAESAAYGNQAV